MNFQGVWENPNGFELRNQRIADGRFGQTVVWDFILDKDAPLQWRTVEGVVIQACRKATITCLDEEQNPTDGGSVPWFVTWWIDKWLCARSFPTHNIGYRFGAVWIVQKDGTSYRMVLSRSEHDELLYWQSQADNASRKQAKAIWAGVRLGGWKPWNEYRREEKSNENKEIMK